jgi:hypothetical protein
LSLPQALRQPRFGPLQCLEGAAGGPFGAADYLATVTQHVEMIQLIGDGSKPLLSALFVQIRNPSTQAVAAIARHLLKDGQASHFLRPSRSGNRLVEPPPEHPAQALGLNHHERWLRYVNFVGHGLSDLGTSELVNHRQQRTSLPANCQRPASQLRHTGNLAGQQDIQQDTSFGQADADPLAHGSEFRLLVVVENHGLLEALLRLAEALLQQAVFLPQSVDLRLEDRTINAASYPGSLAINPLPAHTTLAGVLTDRAERAEANNEGTGNPLLRGYHAHG